MARKSCSRGRAIFLRETDFKVANFSRSSTRKVEIRCRSTIDRGTGRSAFDAFDWISSRLLLLALRVARWLIAQKQFWNVSQIAKLSTSSRRQRPARWGGTTKPPTRRGSYRRMVVLEFQRKGERPIPRRRRHARRPKQFRSSRPVAGKISRRCHGDVDRRSANGQ